MRWVYAAFWILVITMILWQFQSYNKHIDQAIATAGPKEQHFYFLNGATNAASTADAHPKPDGADVKQINFSCTDNSPGPGNITCHAVVKNYGNMKATAIQIEVSPYRDAIQGQIVDNPGRMSDRLHGINSDGMVTNDNPVSQVSQWVPVPDLAPGETTTVDAVFASQQGYDTGDNPDPKIIFHTVKPAAAP